jgi:hypothetical protein
MSVNINTVYQRVLAITNKEQRGYITPQEFNYMANQAQLDIFEQYFYDLNQFTRLPDNGNVNSDIPSIIEEKISIFEKEATVTESGGSNGYYSLPSDLYRLNNVFVQASRPDDFVDGNEAELVTRKYFLQLNKTKLAIPTEENPVYIQSGNKIEIFPRSINQGIRFYYIKKPAEAKWGYDANTGLYDSSTSKTTHFELHPSDETELVIKILALAGVILKDPGLYQIGAAEEVKNVQQEKA